MNENLAWRWMRHYKLYFLLGLIILGIQVFLAYKSLSITELSVLSKTNNKFQTVETVANNFYKTSATGAAAAAGGGGGESQISNNDDEESILPPKTQIKLKAQQEKRLAQSSNEEVRSGGSRSKINALKINAQQLGFEPECQIEAKEAISALQRAKTKDCRKHIAHVACAIQAGHFYAQSLPSHCPTGNRTAFTALGCYRDVKEFRLLSGYFINFKTSNTIRNCIEICLQSGFPYAGVQYGSECFCGNEPPPTNAVKLADSSCNMKCSGDAKEICGGYFSMNIYETGIAKFTAKIAETSVKPFSDRIRIAFLLTLNGRAVRQVHRLIRALYTPDHVFYIHVDARQDYMYRELLKLETEFSNIRLARERYSTIWGGASLLTMLLQCMADLLAAENWHWDFVINLSESDFPVKTMEKLVDFLTANRGRNFVKSHGRETQRFIQKQGLDKTFVECDTHMWRIGDRHLPTGIQIDGGSDWIALSRTFVQYLTTELESDPLLAGLMIVFKHTLLPAESFFHTVLRNSRFCDTYVDNNLHVTNWKRKLGCKCQYKHVVDWCGCSPNDFKPEDWQRLQGTEPKMLFFARKFEPIINQAILFQLEEWLYGPYTNEFVNLHAYWQSLYNAEDTHTKADDVIRTIGESLMRLVTQQQQQQQLYVQQANVEQELRPLRLLELTNFMYQDQYKGFLMRFLAYADDDSNKKSANASDAHGVYYELETRIRPIQYAKVAKNSKFAKRLRNFEVSSEYDQKEQVSRNYAKILGPYTQPVLSFNFAGAGAGAANGGASSLANHGNAGAAHSYNLTLLWINPAGSLEGYSEMHIEDAANDAKNFSKANLRQPLLPGIWTVKLIGRAGIYAQNKFLISPLAMEAGRPIQRAERAQAVNGGGFSTADGNDVEKQKRSLRADFSLTNEWRQHLPTAEDCLKLQQLAQSNALRTEASLLSWIDELVSKFFQIREICAVTEATIKLRTAPVESLPLCKHTMWSSLAPDPKSDVRALLKRR